MELLKLEPGKAKLMLTKNDIEHYGISKKPEQNIQAVFSVFNDLKNFSGIDLLKKSISLRFVFNQDGECEIIVKTLENSKGYGIRTFLFDKEGLKKATCSLKGQESRKNSSLYFHKKSNVYIWEILCSDSSPIPSRLADFGKESFLSSRRDFLTIFCQRIDFDNFLNL